MRLHSTITNALVMPGVSAVDSHWSLLVGLVVDDDQIAWGECVFEPGFDLAQPASQGEYGPAFGMDDGIQLLQEHIIPFLVGQRLTDIRTLMREIDGMVREVEMVRPITADTPRPKLSRRELFTSLVNPSTEIREVVERPLPSALRHGVSQALVEAVAMGRGELVVETAASLFSLPLTKRPIPIHLTFDKLPNPNDPALTRITAASYGLTIEAGEPNLVLGSNGVRLQNRVRQMKNRVARHVENGAGPLAEPISFLFDLSGGYGALYDYNSGKILGAIDGLERTTKPFGLGLVDPIIKASWAEQLAGLKELQSFLRLRKMKTMLLARAGVETAESVEALANNSCCGGIVLDMARLGTLERTIGLAQAAKRRGLAVVLTGVRGETTVHTALALNPALLMVGVGDVSAVADEMNRTVAWLGMKNN